MGHSHAAFKATSILLRSYSIKKIKIPQNKVPKTMAYLSSKQCIATRTLSRGSTKTLGHPCQVEHLCSTLSADFTSCGRDIKNLDLDNKM